MEEEKILERCEKCFHAKWTKDECRICRDGIPIPVPYKPFVIIDTERRTLRDGKNIRRGGQLTRMLKKITIVRTKRPKNKSY